MSGEDVQLALVALDYDAHFAAQVFDVNVRQIQRWKKTGCPPNIAAIFDALLSRRITWKGAKWMKWRLPKERKDTGRYPQRQAEDRMISSSLASSIESASS